jgi:ligand-binding sensor domain-containing protein
VPLRRQHYENTAHHLFFTLCSFWTNAQDANFQFYNTDDGLSGNITYDIVQDEEGLIWVTNSGRLHRFDGDRFLKQPLEVACSLPGPEKLSSMAVYQDSLLLLLSDNNRVILFNPKTKHCEVYQPPVRNENASYSFKGVDPTGSHRIQSRTQDTLHLFLFNDRRFISTALSNVPFDKQVLSFYDAQNKLYHRRQKDVVQIDQEGQITRRIALPQSCSDCEILYANSTPDDQIIAFTSSISQSYQLWTASPQDSSFSLHPLDNILTDTERRAANLFQDSGTQEFWLFGADRHLIFYNQKEGVKYNFRESLYPTLRDANQYYSVIRDHSGTYWVITQLGILWLTLPASAFDQYFAQVDEGCNGYCSFRGITEGPDGSIYAYFYGGLGQADPDSQEEFLWTKTAAARTGPWGMYTDPEGI